MQVRPIPCQFDNPTTIIEKMNFFPSLSRLVTLACFLFMVENSFAHNGKVARAYPLGPISVDGNLSDWPARAEKYDMVEEQFADRIMNDSDLKGYFQVGYRMDNHSLYVAFTIFDEDFIQDTSSNVQWSNQDGLELYLDARHLPFGSGVASFMYSEKLRNINKSWYDAFAKNASWEIMEVAISTHETMRTIEWRINLGDQLEVGRSIGLDATIFDKDGDGSFSVTAWGKGGSKYLTAKNLGDILILHPSESLETISGKLIWDRPMNERLPLEVRLTSAKNPRLWVEVETDSNGVYKAMLLPGQYLVSLPEQYFNTDGKIFSTGLNKPININTSTGKIAWVPTIMVSGAEVEDLIPEKGIMHDPSANLEKEVDNFIQLYMKMCEIPGVSVALIKDGKMVYHKVFGVKNTLTGDKVDKGTLFEAASITKPVFAFAVQRLAERGIIDLDKPLYEYLPYPDIAYDERYKLITAKHVLTHRTGFPNWRSMNPDGKLNLKFTPGTGYGYSGEGFEYLKKVVERITGKNVEQVLQQEVIELMGLHHTFFSRNDSLAKVVSAGHYQMLPTGGDLPESPGMAYSMHTEAGIFTRFMLYLLEQKGLTGESYARMFSKHSEYNFEPGDERPQTPTYMGMSLEIRETPFGKSFGHGGNNGDFKCVFEVYKDLKMGYVIFTNSDAADPLLRAMRMFLVEGKINN